MFVKKAALILFIFFYFENSSGQPVNLEWLAFPAPMGYYLSIREHQLIVDNSTGDVFVGGYFYDTANFQDNWGITKLNSAGSIQWDAVDSGISFGSNYLETIALDNNKNLYATGQIDGGIFPSKGQTNKYDQMGNLLWSKALDTVGGMGTIGHGSFISSNNECYELIRQQNITIRRYDSNGNVTLMFTNDTVTPSPLHAFLLNGIKKDSDDNIYVYGSYADTPNMLETKYFVKKFTSTGIFKWQAFYNPSPDSDNPNDLFIDSQQNVYMTGEVNTGGTSLYGTVAYDSIGAQKWQATFQYFGDSEGDDIVADKAGNTYVNGMGADSTPTSVCFLLKYDTAGNIIWQKQLDSAFYSAKVRLDDDTNVYVAYTNYDTAFAFYNTIARYDSSGNLIWKTYLNPAGGVKALVIDSLKNVYIAGSGYVAKFSQTTGIEEEVMNLTSEINIYPNPTSDFINIKNFNSSKLKNIFIYNTLGEKVKTFKAEKSIFIGDLPKGLYLVQLRDDGGIMYTQKVVLE